MKKLTKLSTAHNPLVKTSSTIEEYGNSVWSSLYAFNNDHLSPPIDYWVAGDIIDSLEVGKSLHMLRRIRNGVQVDGLFCTSKITKIWPDDEMGGILIATSNSIYRLEDYVDNSNVGDN